MPISPVSTPGPNFNLRSEDPEPLPGTVTTEGPGAGSSGGRVPAGAPNPLPRPNLIRRQAPTQAAGTPPVFKFPVPSLRGHITAADVVKTTVADIVRMHARYNAPMDGTSLQARLLNAVQQAQLGDQPAAPEAYAALQEADALAEQSGAADAYTADVAKADAALQKVIDTCVGLGLQFGDEPCSPPLAAHETQALEKLLALLEKAVLPVAKYLRDALHDSAENDGFMVNRQALLARALLSIQEEHLPASNVDMLLRFYGLPAAECVNSFKSKLFQWVHAVSDGLVDSYLQELNGMMLSIQGDEMFGFVDHDANGLRKVAQTVFADVDAPEDAPVHIVF